MRYVDRQVGLAAIMRDVVRQAGLAVIMRDEDRQAFRAGRNYEGCS